MVLALHDVVLVENGEVGVGEAVDGGVGNGDVVVVGVVFFSSRRRHAIFEFICELPIEIGASVCVA